MRWPVTVAIPIPLSRADDAACDLQRRGVKDGNVQVESDHEWKGLFMLGTRILTIAAMLTVSLQAQAASNCRGLFVEGKTTAAASAVMLGESWSARTRILIALRNITLEVFNTSAPSLGEEAMTALRALELNRDQGGFSVVTARDRELMQAVKAALAADPVTSKWSTVARSQLYWFLSVSGRSSLDLENALIFVRHMYDVDLKRNQRALLSVTRKLQLKIMAWNELAGSLTPDLVIAGSIKDLEAQERALFDTAIRDGLFPKPTQEQIDAALTTDTHLRTFWHTLKPLARARPLLNYVVYQMALDPNSRDRKIAELYNTMHTVSTQIEHMRILSNVEPTPLFMAYLLDAENNVTWPGFGDIYAN